MNNILPPVVDVAKETPWKITHSQFTSEQLNGLINDIVELVLIYSDEVVYYISNAEEAAKQYNVYRAEPIPRRIIEDVPETNILNLANWQLTFKRETPKYNPLFQYTERGSYATWLRVKDFATLGTYAAKIKKIYDLKLDDETKQLYKSGLICKEYYNNDITLTYKRGLPIDSLQAIGIFDVSPIDYAKYFDVEAEERTKKTLSGFRYLLRLVCLYNTLITERKTAVEECTDYGLPLINQTQTELKPNNDTTTNQLKKQVCAIDERLQTDEAKKLLSIVEKVIVKVQGKGMLPMIDTTQTPWVPASRAALRAVAEVVGSILLIDDNWNIFEQACNVKSLQSAPQKRFFDMENALNKAGYKNFFKKMTKS
jgi:hypothetical protein